MRSVKFGLAALAISGAMLFAPIAPASAGSLSVVAPTIGHTADTANDAMIHKVGRRGRGFRRGLAIGGLAILGAVIISEAARANRRHYRDYDRGYAPAYRDPYEACAARFRSFDYDTGTYVTYGGEVRICPYLR